ncbi:MAG TPA: SDR family NAD(P)-dependent oxidoreductase, partial [Blastocatellia bacterium]|nr:SDR family NAD(P)-dependent oxidoreductase [Blastocatellia bacterium]
AAQCWLAGVKFDWQEFHGQKRRRRVSLPSYPFQRQRYWIDHHQHEVNGRARPGRLDKKAEISEWFYAPTWERSIPVEPRSFEEAGLKGEQGDDSISWLLFAGPGPMSSLIADRLKGRGKQVSVVMPGEKFEEINDRTFKISPARRDDYDRLLKVILRRDGLPRRILHAWTLTPPGAEASSGVHDDSIQDRGLFSLLFLAQALGELMLTESDSPSRPVKIAVLSNGLHEVTGEEDLRPEKATVLGPCRVIPQEYQGVQCRSIDIQIPEPGTSREELLVSRIVEEIAEETTDSVIAFRGSHRWVPRYRSVRLDKSDETPRLLRDRGVYLITGGLGGVGLEIAAYLAGEVKAQLVLTSRSVFPPREEWDSRVRSHGEEDETGRRILKLKEIESLGAKVMVFDADVADLDRMREIVATASMQLGPVNGVIHAAGVPGGGMIQLQTREKVESALSSKVKGTGNIAKIFGSSGLDFLVLFSSQRSILGGFGGVDYCAANAYLDAFSRAAAARPGTRTISINWDTWKDAGMSLEAARRFDLDSDEALKDGMLSAEGTDAFKRILGAGLPQVIVSTRDFNSLVEQKESRVEASSVEGTGKPVSRREAHNRPELSTPYVEPRNDVERTIGEIWQTLLGIDGIGVYDNFFELGGDSVITIQIIARVNQAGLRLSPKQVFERQTIAGLAEVAGTAGVTEAEQGVVAGPLPLTPIQGWFFAQTLPDPHHYNQALMLEAREKLDAPLLEKAVRSLVAHHDALRLRYTRNGEDWEQANAGIEDESTFSCIDLSSLPGASHRAAIETSAALAQTALSLADGPITRFVFYDLGESSRLLAIIHHLAVDAVSWRVLLEDLETGYRQLKEGGPVALPPKTTSFKRWAELLKAHAQSTELKEEAAFWLGQSDCAGVGLPVDNPDGVNSVASARTLTVALGADETRALLQDVPRAYHTQINDVLLTCLAEAFASWTGRRTLLVELEGHGRDAIFEEADVSRTTGWFTTLYPVALDLRNCADTVAGLRAVKRHLRSIPGNGVGYGVLKYLSGDKSLAALPRAEVSFLYLGQFDQAISESSPFTPAAESFGPTQNGIGNRPHLLAVTGFVNDGRFQSVWSYSENMHSRSTIENLGQGFIKSLRSLAQSSREPVEKIYMPSDFPEADLSQNELDELIAQLSEAEE